ncbi:FAD-binding oxidoreductase [Candidatus Pseudothioglobus singularis]|nr:FAD-binding oxidoreductase [Candidatus Pseudothioglobus singularis]
MDVLSKKLTMLLGHKGWMAPEDCQPWQRDWLDQHGEVPLGVALPKSTAEVGEVLRLCCAEGIPVVPQGGNTGLVGAGVLGKPGGVIISLARMNAISPPDLSSGSIAVDAGVILEYLHQALEGKGLIFPMHMGSEGSAQIGGLIATNAGGSHAFRYGMMQDLVLGLEVVLADGTIWNGMRAVQKDNAGYQLRKLFCGSEGTLGIVTRAILKLSPEPKQYFTALLAVKDSLGLVKLAAKLREEGGEFLTAMEFFSDVGLTISLANIPGLVFPLQNRTSFYLLVEAGSGSMQVPLNSILSAVMEWGINDGIVADGGIAKSEAQRAAFWRLREEQPEGQRRLGVQLKHDISVPPSKLIDFLNCANDECSEILKGVRINPFGHLGDGNVHYNLSPPLGERNFLGLDSEFAIKLGRLATDMGGSFAAEHAIGRTKVELSDRLRDPVERNLMARLKKALDEDNHLNPGVIVSV